MKIKKFLKNLKESLVVFIWNIFLTIRFWLILKFNSNKIYYFYRKDASIPGMKLTFSEEFSYKLSDKWRTDSYYGMRYHPGMIDDYDEAPKEYYSSECVKFTDSSLKLTAIKEPIEVKRNGKTYTIDYQVGQIDSSLSFSQKYGYFEIMSKIPDSRGMWPAFWLTSTESWPPEIDVFEIYTSKKKGFNRFETNVHHIKNGKHKMKPVIHTAFDLSKRPYIIGRS